MDWLRCKEGSADRAREGPVEGPYTTVRPKFTRTKVRGGPSAPRVSRYGSSGPSWRAPTRGRPGTQNTRVH